MDRSISKVLLWSTKEINSDNLVLRSSSSPSLAPSLSDRPLRKSMYQIGKTPIKNNANEGVQRRMPLTQDGFNCNSNDSGVSIAASLSPPGKLSDYVDGPNHKEDANCLVTQNNGDDNQIISKTPPSVLANPLTKNNHLHWSRIERDLASPSAAVRMRAIKAVNNPQICGYTPFDVPAEEQSLHIPYIEPPSITEVMRNIVVYVEVRSGEDNRSAGVRKVIESLGAHVNSTLSKSTTHVVFKDGLLSTYKKAKQMGIPVVSILWIEDCKKQRRICNTEDYPISNIDRYENPELYSKMKRIKSMQPDSESNKRIRNKVNGTPNRKKTSNVTPSPKTDLMKKNSTLLDDTPTSSTNKGTPMNISHYFKKLSNKTLTESPATQLQNKIEDEISITDDGNNLNHNELWSSRVLLFTGLDGQDNKHYKQQKIKVTKESNGFSSVAKTFAATSNNIVLGSPSNELTEMDVTTNSFQIMSLSNATETFRSRETSPTKKVCKTPQNTINLTKTMTLDNDSVLSLLRSERRETINAQNLSNKSKTLINISQNDTNKILPRSRTSTIYSLKAMDESELKENIFVTKSPSSLSNSNMKRRRTLLLTKTKNKSPVKTPKDNTLEIKMKRRTLYNSKSVEKSMIDNKTLQEKEEGTCNRTPRKQPVKSIDLNTPIQIRNNINNTLEENKKNQATQCAGTISASEAVSEPRPARRRTLYTPQNMDLESVIKNFCTPIPILKNFRGYGLSTTPSHISKVALSDSDEVPQQQKQQQQQKKCLKIPSLIKPVALNQEAIAEKEVDVIDVKETTTNSPAVLPFRSTRVSTNRRRTMYDTSMDIIAQRLQCINQTTTNRRSITHMSLDNNTPNKKTNNYNKINKKNDINGNNTYSPTRTNATKAETKKKRKLFVPNANYNNSDDLMNVIPPESSQSSKAQTTSSTSARTPINQKFNISSNTRAIKQISRPPKMIASPFAIQADADSAKNTYRTRRSSLDFELIQNKVILGNPNSNSATDKSNNSNNNNDDNNASISNQHNINNQDADTDAAVQQTLPVLSYTNMSKNEINVIREAVTALGGFRLNGDVNDESSHLITSDRRRTLNLLRALIRGLWILRYDWVLESMKVGHWVIEEPYELEGFSRAIKICRSERQAFGTTYKSELFRHFGPFYLAPDCYPISHQTARELITLCGGKLVRAPSRARYIIGEWKNCHQYLSIKLCVTSYWLLDSITEMQILNVNKYMCKPSNVLNKMDGKDNGDDAGDVV